MRYSHRIIRFFVVTAFIVLSSQAAEAYIEEGHLSGPGAKYTFTVDAETEDKLRVKFIYPVGKVDFCVRAVDAKGTTVINEHNLNKDGMFITLKGGGKFRLTIYSKAGAGDWKAYWNNKVRTSKCFDYKQDYNKAVECFTAAIALDPNDAHAYNRRANVYYDRFNMYEEAIADYTRALEIDPLFWGAYGRRARAHEKIGEYEKAIADYTSELTSVEDPCKTFGVFFVKSAYLHRGQLYEKLGKKTEAKEDYRRACEIETGKGSAGDGCKAYERLGGK